MIVWNVTNRWFASKAEAELTRKELKLSPALTRRVDVRNREELAALLDGQAWLPEMHRAGPAKKADPRQIEMFGDNEAGADTKAGLAAISHVLDDDEAAADSHLETYETEPDATRFDPETGEVFEQGEPIAADRGASF